MPKYVIERDCPVPERCPPPSCTPSPRSRTRCSPTWRPRVQWLHSYVTADKLYCVYIAEDEAAVREHADCGGFPANVGQPRSPPCIDPTTGE